MHPIRQQQTLAGAARVEGVGYWSGERVRVEFRPAPADAGVVFVRQDLGPRARIPAHVDYRVDASRRTSLASGAARVEMVEHVLAALSGMGVDNCEVWVDRCEMPGCDGSSRAFVDAILRAGLRRLSALIRPLTVARTIRVADGECWAEARPASGPGLKLDCRIDYSQFPAIGNQQFSLRLDPGTFAAELADSRTFLLEDEAEQLRALGLGVHVTTRDLIVFGPQGPIDNVLRFSDECVRHKTLDLVGDLSLGGAPLWADVVAHRCGHRLNAELIRNVLADQSSFPTTGWRKTA